MPLITAKDLVKEFRKPVRVWGRFSALRSLFAANERVNAVDGISFDIERGEIIGYLGPNGAGKSTTVKMLAGILVPTSGSLEVAGVVPSRDRPRNAKNIGVVFGQRTQLWFDLPLRYSLETIRDLYDVTAADYRTRLAQFDDLLGIGEFIDSPVRSLSLGQRVRGDLVAAMLYNPPVLYLDEPTVGLDVLAKRALREFILASNAQFGTTVMLTTHDMDDVELLARRIMVIDHGKVLYDGDLASLKRRYVPYRELLVTPTDPGSLGSMGTEGIDALDPTAVRRHETRGESVVFRFDPEQIRDPHLIAQITSAYDISDLQLIEPELEDVIHRLYTEDR